MQFSRRLYRLLSLYKGAKDYNLAMTDTKPEIQPAAKPANIENKPAANNTATSSSFAASKKSGRSGLGIAFLIVLILLVALAAALWYQQQVFKKSSAMLLSQVQTTASTAIAASERSQQALSLAQAQSAQVAQLKTSLNDTQDLYQNLEQAFQTLTDSSSDLVLINDIDHLVSIANQQLLLSGNVGNAIIALEAAQAQLARANRPSLAALQQAINGDVDRLRSVSTVDLAQLSGRLDELKVLVSQAPLLVPDDAAPDVDTTARQGSAVLGTSTAPADTTQANSSGWENTLNQASNWSRSMWNSIRQDLGSFISVRRVQDSSSLLMSPDQAGQLRENLRLRIMTAQLALMMRQPEVWKAETQTLVQALDTRYDDQSADAQRALKLARQLADTTIDVKLPTVNNSLQTLEALREANTSAAAKMANPSTSATDPAGAAPQPGETRAESPETSSPSSAPDTQPADAQPIKQQE